MAGSGRCRGPGAALGVRHRGSPRARAWRTCLGECGAPHHRAEPCFLGPGPAGFPLTALRLPPPCFARPGHLSPQSLPPRLASPTASSCLGGFSRPRFPPAAHSRPCVRPRGRFAPAWAWGHRSGICPVVRFKQTRLARFPLYFLLFISVLRLAGPLPRWCLVPPWSAGQWRCPLRPALCAVSRAPRGGRCRLIAAPCAGHRRTRLGTGFCAELCGSRAELAPAGAVSSCLSACAPGGRRARGPRLCSRGGLRVPYQRGIPNFHCWLRSHSHEQYCKACHVVAR